MTSIMKSAFGKKKGPPPEASTLAPPPSYATRSPQGHITHESDDDEPAQPSDSQPNRPRISVRNNSPTQNTFDSERMPRGPPNRSGLCPGRYEDERDGDSYDGSGGPDNMALTRIGRPSRDSHPHPSPSRGAGGRSSDYDDDYDPRSHRAGPLVRPIRRGGADTSRALIHAMANNAASTGSAAMTIFRSGNDDHGDVLAMPKYSAVPFSSLSAQNLDAIKDVFQVPVDKIETWCNLGRIERHNGTGELRMDKVCALFDRHYAARWEERMEEDRVGITRAKKEKAENAKIKEEKERKRNMEMEEREKRRDKEVAEREASRDKEMKEKAKKAKAEAEAKATPTGGNAVVAAPAVVVPGFYGGYHPFYDGYYPYGRRWWW